MHRKIDSGAIPVGKLLAKLSYQFDPLFFVKLVEQGAITGATKGAKHGELGHTQFLPGNALKYGVDANGDGRVDFYNQTDSLASTANFLRKKGWKPGKGYQEGEPNFAVIKQWNAATVNQQAIAIMGARIDG